MIYKIQSNMFCTKLNVILKRAQKNFDILFSSGNLFLSIKKYSNKDNSEELVKQICKPAKDFFITKINENNLLYESQDVKEWCRDRFVSLEYQEFEEKEQERLQNLYKFLVDLDNNLKKETRKEE